MKRLLIGFVAGVAVAVATVAVHSHYAREAALADMAFGQQIYNVQASARGLRALDDQDLNTARQLLRAEMDNAIDAAYRVMVSHQPSLGRATPNLLRGLFDAEAYLAVRSPDSRSTGWLRDVSAYVRQESGKHVATAG